LEQLSQVEIMATALTVHPSDLNGYKQPSKEQIRAMNERVAKEFADEVV
jgi:hypothetical protein